VDTAARRYRFVLVLFGGLLLLSLPLYLRPGSGCTGGLPCVTPLQSYGGILGRHDLAHPGWLALYWTAALVVGTAAILRRYRRDGRVPRALPVLVATVLTAALTAVLTAADWPGLRTPSAWAEALHLLVFNGATPLVVTAVALLVLAAVERSAALALFAMVWAVLGYLAATWDGLSALAVLGLPVDAAADPAGLRQLPNIAVPAAFLLTAALVVSLSSARRR
jgi:hypothetical protein